MISIQEALDQINSGSYSRIGICGAPKSGKTTMSKRVENYPVVHTDDYISSGWEQAPFDIIEGCQDARLVVEGVQVARAVRKGLELDVIFWLNGSFLPLSRGQESMSKGLRKVRGDLRIPIVDVKVPG